MNPDHASKLKAWISLSRLPFHTVGIFPFILGNALVWHITGHLNYTILWWGTLTVVFIMFSTYYSGEYFDYETDTLSAEVGRNRFSGGSQVLQTGVIPRNHAIIAAFICIFLALGIGALLQFYYRTGYLTLPLEVIGITGGLFYSTNPIRWAYRGLGEIWIGFCYGWLTISSSYYIQTGHFPLLVHLTALPVAFSIFNVILINEFPDYKADMETGKKNLVVRFGKARMSKLYALVSIAIWFSYLFLIGFGIPIKSLLYFSPVFLLSIVTSFQVLRGKYNNPKILERLCAKTLIINLGTTISLILTICV